MKNENNFNFNSEINSCTSRGVCSLSPNIVALQEVVLFFIKESAHYLLELDKFGASNNKINLDIINILSSLVSINEYGEKQLYEVILDCYYLLKNIKETYHNICNDRNIMARDLDSEIIFDEHSSLPKTISLGEKLFLSNYKVRSLTTKNLIEIMLILVKSYCFHMAKLIEFGHFDNDYYIFVLKNLDLLNKKLLSDATLKLSIKKLALRDSILQLKIDKHIFDRFGKISKQVVSRSTEPGKSILVSGDNFFDLQKVLEATIDKDINVYTHSTLLLAHSLEKFRNYKHLKGHYGDTTQSCILDFATFPGAILMTNTSRNITDYLYRGRLFSTDYTVPSGVIKIDKNNFDHIIRAALEAKGFKRGKVKADVSVGFDVAYIKQQFEKISNDLKSGKISRLFIIGMDAYSEVQKEYFRQFFSNMRKDEFAISFYYESTNKNVLSVNVGNCLPLATSIIFNFFRRYYSIKNDNIS